LKYTFQKFVTALVALCLTCAVPCAVYAADSDLADPTPTPAPISDMATDMTGALDEYGGGIMDGFDAVVEQWQQAIDGPLQFSGFLNGAFLSLFTAFPPLVVYIILLCVCVSVAAVIHALTS